MAAYRAFHAKKNMPLYRHLKIMERNSEHLRVTVLKRLQNPTEGFAGEGRRMDAKAKHQATIWTQFSIQQNYLRLMFCDYPLT